MILTINGVYNYRSMFMINSDTTNTLEYIPYYAIDYGYRVKRGEGDYLSNIESFNIKLKDGRIFKITHDERTHDGKNAYDVEHEFLSFISNWFKNYSLFQKIKYRVLFWR